MHDAPGRRCAADSYRSIHVPRALWPPPSPRATLARTPPSLPPPPPPPASATRDELGRLVLAPLAGSSSKRTGPSRPSRSRRVRREQQVEVWWSPSTPHRHPSPAAPTCHRRYKVGDCDPPTTLALDRLAVQGAVNVVSTWWASEGRRRRGGRGRRADAGTHTYTFVPGLAPTTSFPLDIPRRQLVRSTWARACTRARVTR